MLSCFVLLKVSTEMAERPIDIADSRIDISQLSLHRVEVFTQMTDSLGVFRVEIILN